MNLRHKQQTVKITYIRKENKVVFFFFFNYVKQQFSVFHGMNKIPNGY